MLMRFVAVLFFCSFVLKVVYCGPSEVEWQSFTLINQARGAAALPPLVWDQRLYNDAVTHTTVMTSQNCFEHVCSGEPTLDRRTTVVGWTWLGENIGRGSCDAISMQEAWMASAPHKANILATAAKAVGIAMINVGGTCWWTSDFGASTTAPVPPPNPSGPSPPRPPSSGGNTPPIAPGSNNIASGVYAGLASRPQGDGFWSVGRDGGVIAYGSAVFSGSMQGQHLNAPIVSMSSSSSGNGYWLVAADGGIFAFGDAPFFGSTGNMRLNSPVVAMAAHPNGQGYWMVASDGGIFAFGSADFFGSMGGQHLNKPIVGMASTATGNGYWLVATDGGMFSFGDAGFFGSLGAEALAAPVTAMASTFTNRGYYLLLANGDVRSFGDAPNFGNALGRTSARFVGISIEKATGRYLLVADDGSLFAFGTAAMRAASVGTVTNFIGTATWLDNKEMLTTLPASNSPQAALPTTTLPSVTSVHPIATQPTTTPSATSVATTSTSTSPAPTPSKPSASPRSTRRHQSRTSHASPRKTRPANLQREDLAPHSQKMVSVGVVLIVLCSVVAALAFLGVVVVVLLSVRKSKETISNDERSAYLLQ